MNEIVKSNPRPIRVISTRRLSIAALTGLSLASLASAADDASTQLASAATTGMGTVVALLVGIVIIGIGIRVLWFSNANVKKGISAAK